MEKPVSDDIFKAYASLYVYDKGELNAQVEETVSMEISSREKVTFDAAYGRERGTAYIFLPKNASPPFQTIVYYPAVTAFLDGQARSVERRGNPRLPLEKRAGADLSDLQWHV